MPAGRSQALAHALQLLDQIRQRPQNHSTATLIEEAIESLQACLEDGAANEEVHEAIALLQRAAQTRDAESLPDAFAGGEARVPSNPLISAGMAAIWKGGKRARQLQGGWLQSETGQVSYRHRGSLSGHVVVYPNLTQSVDNALPTTQSLWSFVEGLNAFTGDVALAVLAQMVEPSQGQATQYPLLEPVRITTDAIMRYKGIQRWGTDRRLQEERIADEMERLRTLTFDVQALPAMNPITGRRQRGSWSGDRLFDIVRVERFQETLFGDSELLQVAWLVRAGQWAAWWLNADGRVYLARMARVLLELDHQGTAMAKKLGQRILLLAGADTSPQELVVERVLEDVGELPAREQRDKKWAGRTRERFDNALEQLRDAGVLAEVRWCRGEEAERGRGWVDAWLQSSVWLRLTQSPPKAQLTLPLSSLGSSRRRRALTPQQRINGDEIIRARKALGWKQEQLADFLKVTRKHVSSLENGHSVPSAELAARLRSWMNSALNA